MTNKKQTKTSKDTAVKLLSWENLEENNLFVETLEDIGLANAIREGLRGEFVSEEYINSILLSSSS